MKKNEFEIGQFFYTVTGKWQCTDIGTRVIVAIQLDQQGEANDSGPPYSIAEYVFDENDLSGCHLDIAIDDEVFDEMLKNKKLNEIHDAYMFVCGMGYGENSAIFDKQTRKIYFRSDYLDTEEEDTLSDEDYDMNIHIEIPDKNDLDLGTELVFEFVADFIPELDEQVSQIFRKKGGYSRYKGLLDSKGMLQKWYDFENKRELTALLEWCQENKIDLEE